ncbi:hypothetical protein PMZ80_000080 [Knufia obscura]|uniref:DUF4185 domain-containing protein n=1 Tax=Knufia obscura TaxID=1635080 RepID=A0ABR0RZE0_9EURO|nr:hypothetical protein PMZ80_000080 [Knufia obscura]
MDKLTSKFKKHFGNDTHTNIGSQKTSSASPNLFLVGNHNAGDGGGGTADGSPGEAREVKIQNVTELGNVSSISSLVKRDLGFQGKLGDYILINYGDTMFTDARGSDEFRGMTCNSCAIACEDPTQVFDAKLDNSGYPHCLLMPSDEYGEDSSKYALGITNIVETSHGKGKSPQPHLQASTDMQQAFCAGVAEVSIDTTGPHPVPRARRLCKYWWDGETEPWYGDVCALKVDGYVYAYGHAKDSPFVYLTRVRQDDATNLDSYEYWNGESWQHERLKREQLSEKESIFWQINQGQIIWSNYHQCFMFIYCDNFWSCQVLKLKTALTPEGPWSEPMTVHKPKPVQEGGNIYAAVPHQYFDPSGKTLIITYTNHPNTIQAIKVDFD